MNFEHDNTLCLESVWKQVHGPRVKDEGTHKYSYSSVQPTVFETALEVENMIWRFNQGIGLDSIK
jgi:hypothetical protein